SRQYSLHFADRDSRADPAGRAVAGRARSFELAPARFRRRADQSRGVGMVSPRDRQRTLPDRRYVVADGDRLDHDFADAGRDSDQTGIGYRADAGYHSGNRRSTR